MTQSLQRITTNYIDLEDRIRLSGEVDNTAPVVIWLTQRLLQRLLPILLRWLESQDGDSPFAELVRGFSQQAARAELTPQAPVQAVAGCATWLAQAVDITQSKQAVSLTFRGADGQNASLTLATKPLRQWLGIVHDAYLQAGWPLDLWPAWLQPGSAATEQKGMILH
jgi:hypothetical protein